MQKRLLKENSIILLCLLLAIFTIPSATARFIQPDQFIQDVYNPQDLNRYAYVRNNPYTNIDPSGHVAVGFQGFSGSSQSTDIESVASQISSQNVPVKTFTQGRWGEFQAKRYIEKQLRQNPNQPIVIYGHSRGSVSAIRLSEKLGKDGLLVDQLITIDPVLFGGSYNSNKPENVILATNLIQSNSPAFFNGGEVGGAENIDLSEQGVDHWNIDKNPSVQKIITTGTVARHTNYQGTKTTKPSFWERTKSYFNRNTGKTS